MSYQVDESGPNQIMTTTKTRWTTREKKEEEEEEEIQCLRRSVADDQHQNHWLIQLQPTRIQSEQYLLKGTSRINTSPSSSTITSTRSGKNTSKMITISHTQTHIKNTKPPSAFYYLLDCTKQPPFLILVASMCILATAASSILSVNASRTTDGKNLDHHHIHTNHHHHHHNDQRHHHHHHHHHHNQQQPLTDKSHNSNDIQVLASRRFSRSSDSFLNNRHEHQQLQQQQRLKQLLQRDRLKNLIARTSSALQLPTNQHHALRHGQQQHSVPSQLFARQQRHIASSITNKKKSHPLSSVQHPTASDPSVVPLTREARQRDYENDGDVPDDHIQAHGDLDDLSRDDDDSLIYDGDSLDVDFDDDGGEFDADADVDEDADEDADEAEEDLNEDRDEDLGELEADFNIGESLQQLAQNPTAFERHFNLYLRSRAPKTIENLHLINLPGQNEVTNHHKKSLLGRNFWEHEIQVKGATTATPALQKGMIHRRHRLNKPEIAQVPYQSPIVVSISDNSFVSASPIVNSDNADDNSIGSNNIMENITTITTITTTSNDSFDRIMNGESSVHLGGSTVFPNKKRLYLGRAQIFESSTDHNLEPTNDILVDDDDDDDDDKSSKIDRVHSEKSESSHDVRNLLLGNGGNSTTEAYVTDGKIVDSLDRATTMQTNINYSVLGDEEDDDDVDLNVSDVDRVKLDADDLPQSKANTIRYSHIIASPRNELPSYGRKYWHDSHIASIQMVQEEPNELHRGGINSAIIAILFGIGVTGVLIMIVGVKMRSIRERVAYKGRRRSLVPDTDFLINTIPM